MKPFIKYLKTLAGVFFFLLVVQAAAQTFPVLRAQRFFGTSGHDFPSSLLVGPDSSLYVGGWSVDSTGLSRGLLFKLHPSLDKVYWQLAPGGSATDRISALALLPDGGGILFGGTTGSQLPQPDAGDVRYGADVWLGKVSTAGMVLMEKRLGGSGPDRLGGLAVTSYGGFVFAGSTWSVDRDLPAEQPPLSNLWLGITSRAGELLKQSVWGGSGHEWATALAATRDGGYLVAGVTTSPELDSSRLRVHGDAFLRKLDLTGQPLWTRILKKPFDDVIHAVVETEFGMIYAAGSTAQEGQSRQFWLLKFDTNGQLLWERIWGQEGFEELTGLTLTRDGGLIAVGSSTYRQLSHPLLKGRSDLWVIRLDTNGKTIWEQTFGGPYDEYGVALVEFRPGRYYVLGRKENRFRRNQPPAGFDCWLLCIDELPCNQIGASFVSDQRGATVRTGTPIRFVNQSRYGTGWRWEFGDGQSSSEKSPVHRYGRAGTFIVRLTAYINDKCRHTYVHPQPVVVVE